MRGTIKSVETVGESKNGRINAMATANAAWDTYRKLMQTNYDATVTAIKEKMVRRIRVVLIQLYNKQILWAISGYWGMKDKDGEPKYEGHNPSLPVLIKPNNQEKGDIFDEKIF